MYLVTGAAGFIGYHSCLKLLQNNKKVIGVDNINNYYDIKIKKDRLKKLKSYSNFKFFKVNLAKKIQIDKNLSKYKNKITTIIHLAGQAGVRYSIENPHSYIMNNIFAYIELLEFIKNSKKLN